MLMKNINTIRIENVFDFDTVHIFECGQCFRWNKEKDDYVGVVDGHVCKAEYDASAAVLTLETTGGDESFWRNYFDLGTDYSEIRRTLAEAEPGITAALEYGHGIRILNQDSFEILISFIISQNNNIPRIKKNIEALSAKYGEELGECYGAMRYAFPAPENLASAELSDLAELRLGYRAEYIRAAAARFLEEGAPETYEQVIAYLGIGPKVANCIMLFGHRKVDAFPVDTWVKHIMNDMYGFNESDVRGMMQFAEEHFGRYAGYAQQYLFYYYRDRR